MSSPNDARRSVVGLVTSSKMNKSIVVNVERREKHPVYKKYIRLSKRYHAHDETEQCGVGDRVRLIETRPVSKTKRWAVQEILEKAK